MKLTLMTILALVLSGCQQKAVVRTVTRQPLTLSPTRLIANLPSQTQAARRNPYRSAEDTHGSRFVEAKIEQEAMPRGS